MVLLEKNSKSVTILAKEILEQNEGYTISRANILNYIYAKVGNDFFTQGMIARGIANIEKDKDFQHVGHGNYKKLSKDEKEKSFRIEANNILNDTCDKLRKVISKSDDYIKENIDKPSNSLSELREILKTTEYINEIIDTIEKNIKK